MKICFLTAIGICAVLLSTVTLASDRFSVQKDGKQLFFHRGYSAETSDVEFLMRHYVYRFDEDHKRDRSFGNRGRVEFPVAWPDAFLGYSIASDSKGRVVFAGGEYPKVTGGPLGMFRLTKDGLPDRSFGRGGHFTQRDLGKVSGVSDIKGTIYSIKISRKDEIFAYGNVFGPGIHQAILFKLTPEGTMDNSFNEGVPVKLASAGRAQELTFGENGDLFVLNSHPCQVLRITANGQLDANFGKNGIAAVGGNCPHTNLVYHGGKIVVAARESSTEGARFCRLNYDGSPDAHFGNLGVVTISPKTAGAKFNAGHGLHVAIQDGDKIVAVGKFHEEQGSGPGVRTVFRLSWDGKLDMTFGENGFYWPGEDYYEGVGTIIKIGPKSVIYLLYASDAYLGAGTISKIDPDGRKRLSIRHFLN